MRQPTQSSLATVLLMNPNNQCKNNPSQNQSHRRSGGRKNQHGYKRTKPTVTPAVPVKPVNVHKFHQKFLCQLAHGGPTAVIPTPQNLAQVYEAIASKFDGMLPHDILYCTLNTFKPDMDNLLTNNLKFHDFIFAHVHGTRKEITLTKTKTMLGITLTDNGYGKVFIKRIHSNSVTARSQPGVRIGDHIEKVNGQSVVGTRHYNVAALLRAIPVGESFTLHLVEPQKSSFSFVGPRSASASKASSKKIKNAQNGNQTLQFRSNGTAVIQETPSKTILNKINSIFETYLGFNDDILALAGWEIASKAQNFVNLKDLFANSDLGGFCFPDEILFDIWGIVDDYRNKRITKLSFHGESDHTRTSDDYTTLKMKKPLK